LVLIVEYSFEILTIPEVRVDVVFIN